MLTTIPVFALATATLMITVLIMLGCIVAIISKEELE